MNDSNQQYEQQQRVRLAAEARARACENDPEFCSTKRRLTRAMYYWGAIALLDRVANLILNGSSFFAWLLVTGIVLLCVLTLGYMLVVRGSRAAALFMILGSWFSLMVLLRPLLGAEVVGWYRLAVSILMLPQVSLFVLGLVIALGKRSNRYCNAVRAQLAEVEEEIKRKRREHYN